MISEFDKKNMERIISGGEGDWFTACLLRLIAKADRENRKKLRASFPEEVEAYEAYEKWYWTKWGEERLL